MVLCDMTIKNIPASGDIPAPKKGYTVVSNMETMGLEGEDANIVFVKDKRGPSDIARMTPPFDPRWPDDD